MELYGTVRVDEWKDHKSTCVGTKPASLINKVRATVVLQYYSSTAVVTSRFTLRGKHSITLFDDLSNYAGRFIARLVPLFGDIRRSVVACDIM